MLKAASRGRSPRLHFVNHSKKDVDMHFAEKKREKVFSIF